MTAEQITEYLERVIRPRMSTIPGVAEIEIIGAANFADAGLDRPAPARRRGVTASEVLQAISASNFLSAPGATGERVRRLQHHAGVDAPDARGLRRAAAQGEGDAVVRLRDVARVELASEETNGDRHLQRRPGTFIGVFPTPAANPLDTADAVIAELPNINAALP
jgi:multidrug efflux pump